MACYSDKYKHTCSKIIIGVSILMGLMGLIATIFGFVQMGQIPVTAAQKKQFNIPGLDAGADIGKFVVAVGICGIIVAILGCATGKLKNPCFAIPYGLLTFIVTIIFLVIAILAGAVSSQQGQDTMFAAACGGVVSTPKIGGMTQKSMQSNLNLADQYTQFVDQPICSMFCVCPANAAFQSSDKNLTQAKLIDWGRYIGTAAGSSGSYASTYTSGQPSSSTIKSKNLLMLQFAPTKGQSGSDVPTYNTYEECYKKVLTDNSTSSSSSSTGAAKQADNFKKKIAAFVQGGGFEMLSQIEVKYNCAGFCKTPLFYVTKAVTMRPTQECIKPLAKALADTSGIVAVVAAISFLVNFCGFCGSFSLCSKMEGNDDE